MISTTLFGITDVFTQIWYNTLENTSKVPCVLRAYEGHGSKLRGYLAYWIRQAIVCTLAGLTEKKDEVDTPQKPSKGFWRDQSSPTTDKLNHSQEKVSK